MEFTRNGNIKGSIGIGNPMYSKYAHIIEELERMGFVPYDKPRTFIIRHGTLKDETYKRLGQWVLSNKYLFEFLVDPKTDEIRTEVYESTYASMTRGDEYPTYDSLGFRWQTTPEEVLSKFKDKLSSLAQYGI